jgi:hypothetical protein
MRDDLCCIVLMLTVVTTPSLSGAAAPQKPSAVPSPQIRFELQCRSSGDLQATIHNEGTADTALVVGGVLGGGYKYMVGHLSLLIHGDGQAEYFRMYWPQNYPVAISGRLEDWVVPVPVGASFGLQLRASDFTGWRDSMAFPTATFTARLEVRGLSTGSINPYKGPFRVWTEQDALISNAVRVPEDCR